MPETKGHIVMLLDNAFTGDDRVRKEAKSLKEAGFRVTVIALQDDQCDENEIQDGVQVHRWFGQWIFQPFVSSYLKRVDEMIARIEVLDCDILHVHDLYLALFVSAYRKTNPKAIITYDSHEYFTGIRYVKPGSNLLARIKGYFVWKKLLRQEQLALRDASTVLTASQAIADRIRMEHRLSIHPIAVVNAPEITEPNSTKASIRATLSIPDEAIVLVQSGNIYQTDEEMETLFNDVCTIPQMHFLLINDRPRSIELKQKVATNVIWKERIHILKYDAKSLLDCLRACDIGLVYVKSNDWESHYLTSPNRTSEYVAAGLPILSVRQSISEEISRKIDTVVFFDSQKPSSFLETLTNLSMELDAYQQRALKSTSLYRWQDVFKPVIQLYLKLIPSPPIENESK